MHNYVIFNLLKIIQNLVILISIMLLGVGSSVKAADCYTHNMALGKGFATPQLACDDAVFKYQGNKYARIEQAVQNGKLIDSYRCYAKQAANDNNLNDDFPVTVINPKDLEPHCFTQICGPYGDIPDPASVGRGKDFDYYSQVLKVRAKNSLNGRKPMRSDILGIRNLISGQNYYEEKDCDPLLGNWNGRAELAWLKDEPCFVEVHHIIPRVDSNGCPCGKNSFKNALLISKRMNGLFGIHTRSQNLLAHIASISACNQSKVIQNTLILNNFAYQPIE